MGDSSSRTDLSEQVPRQRAELRTFLIADIRGYTTFTADRGDEAAAKLAGKFARVAREAVEGREGTVLELRGDEAVCVFVSPRQAVSAAIDLQDRLVEETGADASLPLPAGIGLDVGEVVPIEGGYRGGALNMAARLCGIAKAGEVLASPEVIHLAGKLDSITYVDRGTTALKGIAIPVRVMKVVSDAQDHVAQLAPYAPRPSHPSRLRGPRWLPPALAGRRGIALAVAVVVVALGIPIALTRGAGTGLAGIAGNSLGRIDPKNGRIVSQTAVGNFPGHVAAGDGSIWVTNEGDDSVSQIDPASNAVTDTITSPDIGHDPSGIAVGFGSVWVAESLDGTVARIDLATKKVVAHVFVGAGPDRVAVGDDRVWVSDLRDGTVVSIDPSTNQPSKPISVGRQPTGIAVANDGAVWVTLFSENVVVRIDPASLTETTVNVGNGPNDVAASDSGIWVVNSLDDTVTRIALDTYRPSGLLQTDPGPDAVAVNGSGVWVSNEYGESIDQFDPSSGQLVRRTPLGNRAEGIAATDEAVFVASRDTGRGHRGGKVLAEEPFSAPIDPAAGFIVLPPYIFDGLTAFKRVGGIESDLLVPDLASTIPVPTDGGTTYTFQLRPGIRFSNGNLLEPADVKATFERLFEVSTIAPLAAYWGPAYFTGIVGADGCVAAAPHTCDLAGIQTDAKAGTVTFHLTGPDVTFPTKLAIVWIIQAGTPAKMLTTAPVPGTGPYMIQTYGPGKDNAGTAHDRTGAARMVRNPYFHEWSKAAKPAGFPEEIDWTFLIPSNAGTKDVETGAADYAPVDGPAQRERAETFFPSLVHALPVQLTWWINMNTQSAPFNDPVARRAVAFAINRATAVGAGSYAGAPSCHLTPPGFPGYDPIPCRYSSTGDPSSTPDIEKAQRLVTLSGTRGDPVTYNAIGSQGAAPTDYVRSLLTQLGYQVRVVRIPRTEPWIDVDWRGFYPDFQFGSSYLGAICSSDWITCGKTIDAEVKHADRVERSDPAASVPLWAKIDRDIVLQASAIPVHTVPSALLITSARVHSFQVATNGVIYKDQFWVV